MDSMILTDKNSTYPTYRHKMMGETYSPQFEPNRTSIAAAQSQCHTITAQCVGIPKRALERAKGS